MALYEYLCPKCRNQFEFLRPMSEAEKPAKCPKCGSKAQKLISGFGSSTGDSIQPAGEPFSKRTVVGEVGLAESHGERRDMVQKSLLQQLEEVASKVRLLEREKSEAVAKLQALEREKSELISLISLASAKVERILKERATEDISQPRAVNAPAASMTCEPLDESCADPQRKRSEGQRSMVFEELGNEGHKAFVPAVLGRVLRHDPSRRFRRLAAFLLGTIEGPEALGTLSSALNDADKGVRREAVVGLGRICTAEAIGPLMTALNDEERSVRKKAIEGLAKIGEPATQSFISALRHPDSEVCQRSSRALVRIGQPAVLPLMEAIFEEEDSHSRAWAADSLGNIRDPRAVASLVMALMDPDSSVRGRAADALMSIGKPAVEPLARVLRVMDNTCRGRVADVLVRTRRGKVQSLIEALRDEDGDVRATLSQALVQGSSHDSATLV